MAEDNYRSSSSKSSKIHNYVSIFRYYFMVLVRTTKTVSVLKCEKRPLSIKVAFCILSNKTIIPLAQNTFYNTVCLFLHQTLALSNLDDRVHRY